ncbi:MAG: 1-(5-phosphoribosyl)-5-[(5-phosphoribosylamino)methylideneamino]imidazole-4-carboxamide isomerase [Flavobacteriales bacterium]|nr:1-(5-phosphoribosyl)-5-[(5-phosphoribosylamino)methylideneamino]imidazole-4-carboxamide isomerase [Flavobacteriales bacterium]|tara:strand:+ start:2480 stop:3199 length:720 start_codon:yes stop_codon:yes gene_type:complete
MIIVPAIDLIDGKAVRLTKGDYNQKKIYNENPLAVAKEFEAAGFTHLHLVDLDGAKSGHIVNHKVLKEITQNTSLKVDFGGGVKTNEDIDLAFECGASQITGGSIAAKNKDLFEKWIRKYGNKIILGADVKDRMIAVNGWLETSDLQLFSFLDEYHSKGIEYVICTDISKDGLLSGSSNELYAEIMREFPKLKLIASGGVTSEEDLKILQDINVYGAIVGKAIYEGRLNLQTLIHYHKV